MSAIHYHDKYFKIKSGTENGEVSEHTLFHYQQEGDLVFAKYSGGDIRCGHLIGKVDEVGNIDMRYHHMNVDGSLRTGKCQSTPELREDGTLILHEKWEWMDGDLSKGKSTLIEVP